jgi:hypothetical protein
MFFKKILFEDVCLLMRTTVVCAVVIFVIANSLPANAQVTGTFSPGVYNEPAYGPLPIRREIADPMATSPSLQAIQLRSEIVESRKPYIGTVFAGTNQSLVDRNYQLSTVTQGVEAGFFPRKQMQIKIQYLPTLFGLNRPTLAGQEFRVNVLHQPTNRLTYIAGLGLFHTFHNVRPNLSVLGRVGARYAISDRVAIFGDLNRYIIGNSRLSATGLNLPLNGAPVGRVKANQATVGINWRPTYKTDVQFAYSGGVYTGQKIQSNPFQEFNFRVGHNVVSRERTAHLQFLQPSYQLLVLNYKRDQSGFGNLSLIPSNDPDENIARLLSARAGQVGLPRGNGPGVGGYFSPQIFILNNFRLDAGGRLFRHVFWNAGGGLGPQNFKDSFTPLSQTTIVGAFNASIIARINEHVTLEQGGYYLQAGNDYRRVVLYQQSRYYF